MAVFAFYEFKIKEIARESELAFPDFAPKERTLDLGKVFSDMFEEHKKDDFCIRDLSRRRKIEESFPVVKYHYEVLAHYGEIILFLVENNKKKTTIVDKQKVDHSHHPFCNVIIDYRQGQFLLGVERSQAFDNKPEKLLSIIERALNYKFSGIGYLIEFTLLVQEDLKFWDAVTEIRRRNQDRVKRVCLDFRNNCSTEDINCNSSALCTALTLLAQKANANGYSVLEAGDSGEVDVDAIQEDLVNLADICYNQGEYDLTVHFQSYGIYRYGADVKAQFGVNDFVLDNFAGHADEAELFESNEKKKLCDWLEYTKSLLINNYVTSPPPTIQPKRGHRR